MIEMILKACIQIERYFLIELSKIGSYILTKVLVQTFGE